MIAARVAAASNAWLWVPDEATSVAIEDCLLVRYADHWPDPLVVLRTGGLTSDLVDRVLMRARSLQASDHLIWWVKLDAPVGLEAALVARGGVREETLDVLARPLATDDPVSSAPAAGDVDLRWLVEVAARRDAFVVGTMVFGGSVPSEEFLAADVPRQRAEIQAGRGGGVVAYLNGEPVGTGGVALVDRVARLWGGAVVESARRRGVYGALLVERLVYARRHGATLALVKGRVATSAPILRRAGFEVFGQERGYRLPLPPR